MDELTGWYPPEIKPARKGVYEVVQTDCFAYFDGERFCFRWWVYEGIVDRQEAINRAYVDRNTMSHSDSRWRGLSSDPAKGRG